MDIEYKMRGELSRLVPVAVGSNPGLEYQKPSKYKIAWSITIVLISPLYSLVQLRTPYSA